LGLGELGLRAQYGLGELQISQLLPQNWSPTQGEHTAASLQNIPVGQMFVG
jgi:hypothetical protein